MHVGKPEWGAVFCKKGLEVDPENKALAAIAKDAKSKILKCAVPVTFGLTAARVLQTAPTVSVAYSCCDLLTRAVETPTDWHKRSRNFMPFLNAVCYWERMLLCKTPSSHELPYRQFGGI
jgi:hypothetical protein